MSSEQLEPRQAYRLSRIEPRWPCSHKRFGAQARSQIGAFGRALDAKTYFVHLLMTPEARQKDRPPGLTRISTAVGFNTDAIGFMNNSSRLPVGGSGRCFVDQSFPSVAFRDYELVSKKERLKAVESEEREEEEKPRKEVKKELEEELVIKEELEEEQEGESEAEAYPLLAGAPDAEEPLAFSNEFALEETLQLVSLDDVSPSANPVAQESFKKDVSDEAKGKACSVTRKEKDFFEECHEELELFFDMIQTPQFHHNPRPFSGRPRTSFQSPFSGRFGRVFRLDDLIVIGDPGDRATFPNRQQFKSVMKRFIVGGCDLEKNARLGLIAPQSWPPTLASCPPPPPLAPSPPLIGPSSRLHVHHPVGRPDSELGTSSLAEKGKAERKKPLEGRSKVNILLHQVCHHWSSKLGGRQLKAQRIVIVPSYTFMQSVLPRYLKPGFYNYKENT
ncbi:unnamed protein product [Bemisia tabaci]|uniref:Uncharacterized protein n=1 Tax=Bemisia tabaci TaxID=7038 RepID=A0A9P0A869_BEMTA|nr:unnamed protein product [Bemisia tabaci]